MVRIADKLPVDSYHGGATRCQLPDCNNRTRENKPLCPDHVEHAPYVVDVLRALEARELEIERVSQCLKKRTGTARTAAKLVDPNGGNCHEIIQHLRVNGARTVERLRREVFSQSDTLVVTEAFVIALANKGIVRLGRSKRGSTTVDLIDG